MNEDDRFELLESLDSPETTYFFDFIRKEQM